MCNSLYITLYNIKAEVALKLWPIRGLFKQLVFLLAALPTKTCVHIPVKACTNLTLLDNPAAKVIIQALPTCAYTVRLKLQMEDGHIYVCVSMESCFFFREIVFLLALPTEHVQPQEAQPQ